MDPPTASMFPIFQSPPPPPPPPTITTTSTPTLPSSTTTTTTTTTTRTIFRPRRSEDWQQYRPIIESLYRTDQLKLRDVKRHMEQTYGFFASEKQYKDRLAAWNVRKNVKANQVHYMLHKQRKRASQGKLTAFRVSGGRYDIDAKRIARFVRRYGTSWEAMADQDGPEPGISFLLLFSWNNMKGSIWLTSYRSSRGDDMLYPAASIPGSVSVSGSSWFSFTVNYHHHYYNDRRKSTALIRHSRPGR